MNDKKRAGGIGSMTGASSLLIIFAVLCLTIFALLSLNTAVAGDRLSQHSAEQIAGYYQAETRAHEILAQLRLGRFPDGVTADGDIYTYSCSLSETSVLEVSVRLSADGSWQILRWQSVPTLDWQFDDSIDVWDGDIFF